MPCNKHKTIFSTRKAAKKAAKFHNRNHSDKAKMNDVYYCAECFGFHLTSMTKFASKKLKEKNG